MSRVMAVGILGLLTLVAGGCQPTADPLSGCVEVQGTFNPAAPAFIVFYHSGVDPVAETSRLETKYNFSAGYRYKALLGFSAELSAAAVAGIRCESTVSTISHGGLVTTANLRGDSAR